MHEEDSIITCKNCGEPLEAGWKECPVCLTPTSSGVLTCPNCQTPIKKNWKICPRCETILSGWETPPAHEFSAAEKRSDSKNGQFFVSMVENEPAAIVGFGLELPITKGDVLGDRYRIIQPLGAGGFGAVYQVDDLVLNEQMALKIVVAGEGKAQRAAEQILHEFKLRERINDIAYIIKAQDPRPCEYKGLSLVLLPMEFADGKSMRQWLVQNQDIEKRQKKALEFFKQACLGIKAIHDAGLVHLDIKPENILLVDGKAKVADFGIGRYGANQFKDNPEQLLHQGIGTPQYMSPEQFHVARQKDVGPASDIYSLGIVLFELLDGNLPFDGTAIELRDKHLNMQPPRLTGKLEKWSRIADRCLVKNPEERYLDIGWLIADLDRAAQGATLSIDVSCPKCGHINANPDIKKCEKCRTNLDSLFRPCPRCGRAVRLDIENCPGCGENVAAHYLLLDRKEQIEKLKDEDPVAAIEILEMVLHTGSDDYLEKLAKDLRQKQSKVGSLIAEAEEATTSGLPKQAIKAWQKVLELIPRHKVAVGQVRKLGSLLKDFRERWEKAIRLMDEAKFQDADNILQSCLKDAPARNDIRGLLDTCRNRSQKYRDAFDHSEIAMGDKLIQEANKQIVKALSQAPESPEANSLLKQITTSLDKTNSLLAEATASIRAAKFEDADTFLNQAENIWPTAEGLNTQKEISLKNRATYKNHLDHAYQAKEKKDLALALEKANLALSICPDSMATSDFIESIKNTQHKAMEHLDDAKKLCDAAEFNKARNKINKAKSSWGTLQKLNSLESDISPIEKKYKTAMSSARSAQRSNGYAQARNYCMKALELCPKSIETNKLKQTIEEQEHKARQKEEKQKKTFLTIGKWTIIFVISAVVLFGGTLLLLFLWKALMTNTTHGQKVAMVIVLAEAVIAALIYWFLQNRKKGIVGLLWYLLMSVAIAGLFPVLLPILSLFFSVSGATMLNIGLGIPIFLGILALIGLAKIMGG